ncbi:helix-turn-helix transcriptional regulator [Virgisporangium ochraceum]|uniref:Transcriptional regulator n=1 Tax=Virgisporangium ochraceum TaxID=65505 RepID=A0A8J3ZSC4_9ACTN|nr:AraC family transcriptional regulator [Virgisporangium ochraceum]GIJ69029.1 transcriptional regulator [Virgisporangium ochraceum]
MTHVHSVPVNTQPEPCETVGRRPAAALRPYVVGYSGFRSGSGAALPHRVLPLNLTVAIVDLTGEARVVTGPRATPAVFREPVWRSGVTVGFTPLGVRALLGLPAPELVGRTVPLPDLLAGGDAELVDRLRALPLWADRFASLDAFLSRRLAPVEADPLVTHAWWQLQVDRVRVGALAQRLAVSRRHLETGFRREIGVTPGTVGRIARFQHAVGLLARGSAPLHETAVDSGYADQPHFTREIRAMSGLTPTELCAFLQYRDPVRR